MAKSRNARSSSEKSIKEARVVLSEQITRIKVNMNQP